MNIIDLYSTRIQKSFDEDQEEIISLLSGNPKLPLKLINYYKGLPLSYPATVAAIDRGTVDFDVQAEQAFAIEKSRYAFIRSSMFKHDVFAQVQYVNVKKRAASFVKFSYVEIMAERRNFIRMVPDPQPNTFIVTPAGVVEGSMYDVSLSGINVAVDQSCPLEVDTEATTRFMLKNIDQSLGYNLSIPGKLVGISGDSLPRNYRFTITLDRNGERQLSQYIIQRQIEIIKEIKDAVL
jgi:hypothetical protein